MVGAGASGAPNVCSADWLLIPCAKMADRVTMLMTCEDRLCGGALSAELGTTARTIISKLFNPFKYSSIKHGFLTRNKIVLGSVRPFRLAFHSDAVEAPNDLDNRGFCLEYVQQPCTNGK